MISFLGIEYREDVYSPASNSSATFLPSLTLSDEFVKEGVIPTLDVSDAFLPVPQPIPPKISLDGCEHIISSILLASASITDTSSAGNYCRQLRLKFTDDHSHFRNEVLRGKQVIIGVEVASTRNARSPTSY